MKPIHVRRAARGAGVVGLMLLSLMLGGCPWQKKDQPLAPAPGHDQPVEQPQAGTDRPAASDAAADAGGPVAPETTPVFAPERAADCPTGPLVIVEPPPAVALPAQPSTSILGYGDLYSCRQRMDEV